MSLMDEPAIQINTVEGAHSHNTAVAVSVALLARHGPSADLVGERECGSLTAAILNAFALARLTALRGVNAMETYARPVNLDGVTVDHRGHARELFSRSHRRCEAQQ